MLPVTLMPAADPASPSYRSAGAVGLLRSTRHTPAVPAATRATLPLASSPTLLKTGPPMLGGTVASSVPTTVGWLGSPTSTTRIVARVVAVSLTGDHGGARRHGEVLAEERVGGRALGIPTGIEHLEPLAADGHVNGGGRER